MLDSVHADELLVRANRVGCNRIIIRSDMEQLSVGTVEELDLTSKISASFNSCDLLGRVEIVALMAD